MKLSKDQFKLLYKFKIFCYRNFMNYLSKTWKQSKLMSYFKYLNYLMTTPIQCVKHLNILQISKHEANLKQTDLIILEMSKNN